MELQTIPIGRFSFLSFTYAKKRKFISLIHKNNPFSFISFFLGFNFFFLLLFSCPQVLLYSLKGKADISNLYILRCIYRPLAPPLALSWTTTTIASWTVLLRLPSTTIVQPPRLPPFFTKT